MISSTRTATHRVSLKPLLMHHSDGVSIYDNYAVAIASEHAHAGGRGGGEEKYSRTKVKRFGLYYAFERA